VALPDALLVRRQVMRRQHQHAGRHGGGRTRTHPPIGAVTVQLQGSPRHVWFIQPSLDEQQRLHSGPVQLGSRSHRLV